MQIKDLAEKYELSKEPDVDFWKHQQSGQWILTHNAVEKIAIMEKIEIKDIKILNSEVDLVRMLITMRNDKAKEVTSIGEADRKNCRSQYLGCMAEKRGIDRCVLKLISAYQYGISSEVEADDFAKPRHYQKTQDQLAKFDKLLSDDVFVGEKNEVKANWKKCNSFSQTELFLSQMKNKIENKNEELEYENQ